MKSLKYLIMTAEKWPVLWDALKNVDEQHIEKPLPDWKVQLMEAVSTAINKTIVELDANHPGDERLEQAISAYLYFCADLYHVKETKEDNAVK